MWYIIPAIIITCENVAKTNIQYIKIIQNTYLIVFKGVFVSTKSCAIG